MYEVDIKDVIKNYDLNAEKGFLFCLLEAISNALYCSIKNSSIQITVNIRRQYTTNEIVNDEDNYIQSFKIEDNGTGFIDDNFKKFTRQIYKTNHTCGKGLGRVSFLKVFNDIEIESIFEENKEIFQRTFFFGTETISIDDKKPILHNTPKKTTIAFKNIKPEFQKYTQKNIDFYRDEILKHFYIFLYYLKSENKKFEIKLIDDSGDETERIINTAQLNKDQLNKEQFYIEDKTKLSGICNIVNFELWHIKTKNIGENKVFYVVDERSAGEIDNIDLPLKRLEDKEGISYYYNAYLKSPFFGRFLNESRTKLTLPSNKPNSDQYITEEKIQETIKEKINLFLKYELEILNKKKENNVRNILNDNDNKITNNKAYSYILMDKESKKTLLDTIKFNDPNPKILSKIKDLHEKLQEETVKKINQTIQKIQKAKNNIDFKKFEDEIKSQIQQVNMGSLVNLSSYIMYRKYILNIFNEGIKFYNENKVQNEAFFHNILLPKNSVNSTESNLWLIDDQFLYFDGQSEVSIEDIEIKGNKIIRDLTEEEKEMLNEFNKKRLQNRIDLLFFPEEKKCIIIELKDPKVGLNDNVFQMDRYVQYIANFVKPEFSIEDFYTYLITDQFNKYDKPTNGYRKIYGIDGFVRNSVDVKSYDNDNPIANQYSEVIRYTDIYKRANKRNKIFFEKMNLQFSQPIK
ncbi:MAG: ATP-binding protein [Planctomycetaceae bacterium]|jgi:hypothetical protein|nr:ATP-binding protein [Planctomycetaceae bacterium]